MVRHCRSRPNDPQVWIYGSRIHIIPVSHISPPSRTRRRRPTPADQDVDEEVEDDEFIAAHDALSLLRDPNIVTFAPPEVESIVWQRISG